MNVLKFTLTLLATLALTIACASPLTDTPQEQPAVTDNANSQILGEPVDATSRPAAGTQPAPTRYQPYADIEVPTPTPPAWMGRISNGSTTRQAGGKAIDAPEKVLTDLTGLRISAQQGLADYDRDEWRAWIDADRDCQNTRAEVLIAESEAPVTFRNDNGCTVDTGEWRGPWSGQFYTRAADLDVDHHVPLAHAHQSGAATWPASRKVDYANDLAETGALNAMLNSLNRQKGAKGPDEWRPPDRSSWCRYATDWITVKTKWDLSITPQELTALTEMLNTCTR